MSFTTRLFPRVPLYYSTTARSGVNIKRINERMKKVESHELLHSILVNCTVSNADDINNIRSQIINSNSIYTEKNVDKSVLDYFISKQQYKTSLKYIEFLSANNEKLNLFLTNQYFRIYFYKRYTDKRLSAEEEEQLCTLYRKLRKEYPVLDIISLECAILGLSITKKWQYCFDMINEIKKVDEPSAISYSAVAAGAFLNEEEEMGWKIFNKLFDKERMPHDVTYSAYFERLANLNGKSKVLQKLSKLFQECGEKDFIFSERIISELRCLLKKHSISHELTSIDKRGCCLYCQKKLDNLELPNEIFDELKEKIVGKVIVGRNIFSKTTPEEFSRFQEFLKTITKCNVVIDGLNVAYTAGNRQSPKVYSSLLAHVVAHFADRGKDIVVLGRAHMHKWPKQNWNYILENSKVFLTQDISQDDPYLLYCALNCGKDAIIVSRDLMRSHLFLLKNPKDKLIFSRWLTERQYQLSFVTNEGKVIFKFPLPYTRTMQYNCGNWHIPFNLDIDKMNSRNEHSNRWLCIQSL